MTKWKSSFIREFIHTQKFVATTKVIESGPKFYKIQVSPTRFVTEFKLDRI